MNERIEHITKQVDEYFDDLTIEFSREAWMEKFAELIIRECANAIITDSRLNDVRSAANGCVRTINEHFGVEE